MTPNAKESGAVAWQFRYRKGADGELSDWIVVGTLFDPDAEVPEGYETRPLIPQSALHAAEAELGELRRRVGELADEGERFEKSFGHDGKSLSVNELRQLLASDGGAGGDDR